MYSSAQREFPHKDKKETRRRIIRLSWWNSVWKGGRRVYMLGVVGSCLCAQLLSYMHTDTGGCIAGTTAANNLGHNAPILCWLANIHGFEVAGCRESGANNPTCLLQMFVSGEQQCNLEERTCLFPLALYPAPA